MLRIFHNIHGLKMYNLRVVLFSEPCTGFPSDWQSVEPMTSGTTTPSGTSVNVVCTDSRANKGSTEVTCKSGQEWTFEVKPDCVYR